MRGSIAGCCIPNYRDAIATFARIIVTQKNQCHSKRFRHRDNLVHLPDKIFQNRFTSLVAHFFNICDASFIHHERCETHTSLLNGSHFSSSLGREEVMTLEYRDLGAHRIFIALYHFYTVIWNNRSQDKDIDIRNYQC